MYVKDHPSQQKAEPEINPTQESHEIVQNTLRQYILRQKWISSFYQEVYAPGETNQANDAQQYAY